MKGQEGFSEKKTISNASCIKHPVIIWVIALPPRRMFLLEV